VLSLVFVAKTIMLVDSRFALVIRGRFPVGCFSALLYHALPFIYLLIILERPPAGHFSARTEK